MDDVHFVSMVCEWIVVVVAEGPNVRIGFEQAGATLPKLWMGTLLYTRIMGTEQWWLDIFSSHCEYSNTCIHKLCKIQQGMWLVEKLEEMEYCLLMRMVVNQIRAYS